MKDFEKFLIEKIMEFFFDDWFEKIKNIISNAKTESELENYYESELENIKKDIKDNFTIEKLAEYEMKHPIINVGNGFSMFSDEMRKDFIDKFYQENKSIFRSEKIDEHLQNAINRLEKFLGWNLKDKVLYLQITEQSNDIKDIKNIGNQILDLLIKVLYQQTGFHDAYKEAVATVETDISDIYDEMNDLYEEQKDSFLQESILCVGNESRRQYQVLYDDKNEAGLYVEPIIWELRKEKSISFDELKEKLITLERGKVYVLFGKGGSGKSTILKRLFIAKNSDKDYYIWIPAAILRNTKQNAETVVKKIFADLKKGRWKPKDKVYVFLDGIDEAFRENHIMTLNNIIKNCKKKGLITILACQEVFYQRKILVYNRRNGIFWSEEFRVEEWNRLLAEQYIKRYLKKDDLISEFEKLYMSEKVYEEFLCNPFNCTLLLYLFENGEKSSVDLRNAYHLYSRFYELYLEKELEKEENQGISKSEVYQAHYCIAEKLYMNRNSLINVYKERMFPKEIVKLCEYPVVKSLLKLDFATGNDSYVISGFSLNDSFVEFLLIRRVIEYGLIDAKKLNKCFKLMYRHFQYRFWEMGVEGLTIEELRVLSANLEEVYNISSDDVAIKSSALRFLGRMPDKIIRKSNFFSQIYWKEDNLQLKINAATNVIDHNLDDEVERHYINSLLLQDSRINECLRAWTRYYFGDTDLNDPEYEYDEGGEWTRIREKRLKRLQNKADEVLNIRPLDLVQLLIFYRSRNWNDLSREDYLIIKECMTDIEADKIPLGKWEIINQLLNIFEKESRKMIESSHV